jgi:hypothetical protein
MFKPTILKVVIFVVLGAGGFFFARNAHFDPFPCKVADRDWNTKQLGPTKSESCSLLDIKRAGEDPMADAAELEPGGYALAGLLFVVLPFFIAFGIGHLIQRKKTS